MYRKSIIIFILFALFLNACAPMSYQELDGASETEPVTVENIPEEPSRQELTDSLERNSSDDIAAMLGNTFYLLDVVSGESEEAYVYATRQFSVQELANLVAELKVPEEISEFKENRQILVYDDHFVTFQQAEENEDITLIEVASDEFVENNYSPNYFNGFFTFLLLNRMIGSNNWSNNRMERCRNTQCYGGYSNSRSYNTNNRGMSNYRGGGPGAGK